MTRKYVHHNMKEMSQPLSFKLGCVSDSFDYLKQLCNDKSIELLKSAELLDAIDNDEGNKADVTFWTEDYFELIGVSHFIKSKSGNISFSLDFSVSTL